MNARYLSPQQEMKTMLICSLLDISNIGITDRMLKLCGVLESANHLNGSILHQNTEGMWKTKHPAWDQKLFSFLYGTITVLPERRKHLEDSLVAIYGMREETVAYSAIMTLYDMARRNFVPMDLFEVVFKESISQKPLLLSNEKVSNIFVLISDAYYVLKDFRGAFDNSNEALTWNSDNAMAYMNKGIALTHLGRNDEGIEYLDKALDMDRGLARAWKYKGFALFHFGRYKEASMSYDKALEIDPNDLTVYVSRSLIFEKMGEHEKAIECCDYVLNQNELNKSLQLKLLERLPLEALDLRDGYILNIDLQTSYILSLKSTSLLSVGKSDEAISCFDKALQINPNDTDALYNKGDILVKLGKYGEAMNAYQRLLNIGQALLRVDRSDARYCFDKTKKLGVSINSLRDMLKNPKNPKSKNTSS
jgi:tetratricopeptide (TPR) repeat protein